MRADVWRCIEPSRQHIESVRKMPAFSKRNAGKQTPTTDLSGDISNKSRKLLLFFMFAFANAFNLSTFAIIEMYLALINQKRTHTHHVSIFASNTRTGCHDKGKYIIIFFDVINFHANYQANRYRHQVPGYIWCVR